MKIRPYVQAAVLPLVFLPGLALATTGYFSLGYGVKSAGMGGVGIALPQDGLAAATNPAGTAFVGDRVDLGLTWFMPNRHAEITGSMMPGLNGDYNGNGGWGDCLTGTSTPWTTPKFDRQRKALQAAGPCAIRALSLGAEAARAACCASPLSSTVCASAARSTI